MHRRLVVGITVLVLATLVTGVAVAEPLKVDDDEEFGHESTGTSEKIELSVDSGQTGEIDRAVFEITVFENGDARWAVENRHDIPATDEEQREQFSAFADEFISEETETFENFRLRADRLTQEGTNNTDREMQASDFERDARYDEFTQEGVVEMSFHWKNFAETDGEEMIVSDVFAGGLAILEDQQLRIKHGGNLSFTSVSPSPDQLAAEEGISESEWVSWDGPREFETEPLRLTLLPENAAENHSPEGPENDDADDEDPNESDSSSLLPLAFALAMLVGAGGGALWYLTTRDRTQTEHAQSTTTPDTPSATTEPQQPTETTPIPDEELLSDEDRVIKLLEENGGRMRQVTIVEETEWSKSKVSMLLSDMAEEGDISKLRVGRENIISLAGEEPEAAGSPFDDEGE